MKQVLQNFRTGELMLADVPIPSLRANSLLVRNACSLVSVGTERQLIDFAQKSLLGKARARPDLMRKVMSVAQNEGLLEAYRQATSRLDTPLPLGYSSAGEIIAVDEEVDEFKVGDRVACAGSGYACHAEIISVPKTLCVSIPDNVDFESAAFVALGAIALHSVRLAELTLGENVSIIGLGLLGQITAQIVKASGCNVFGIDIDTHKIVLAKELGTDAGAVIGQDDVPAQVSNFTDGVGADIVIIMASTSGNEPVELAAEITRERGKIVATGLVGLDMPRKLFYEKELDFKVPRAWGPGMYDENYERGKVDYPLPYIRWSAKRNMEEFLRLVSQEKVKLDKIITHRFPIKKATEAYEMVTGKSEERYIGLLLTYDKERLLTNKIELRKQDVSIHASKKTANIGLIGAGEFAKARILPALKRLNEVNFKAIATASGTSARDVGDKFGFAYCSTDYQKILEDVDVNCVFIATRHNLHAKFVIEALKHGKDVFVEKPLALSLLELKQIVEVWNESQGRLMVGFNRRFSPFSIEAKQLLSQSDEPMVINCRVNAGFVPKDSWIQNPNEGGGRIIGEVCHFIDLIQYFTDSIPTRVYSEAISKHSDAYMSEDNVIITIKLKNGSTASITYVANGDKSFSRERVEIFRDQSVCLIDNFKSMSFTRRGKQKKMRKLNVDRGHQNEFSTFISCVKNGDPMPVDFKEYVYTTLATFKIIESLNKHASVDIDIAELGGELP